MADRGQEEAQLLSRLIKNQCVNKGTPDSGNESLNAAVIGECLDGVPGVSYELFESLPGRANLVADWGDGDGPTLALLAHMDVVPADPKDWSFDPFSGAIENGYVHGRGAVDMLNLLATMTLAVSELARSGFTPKGRVRLLAVADEEAGGKHGAGFLTSEHWDRVASDFVLTEWGGVRYDGPDSQTPVIGMLTGEKGVAWVRVTFAGKPAHGSRPYGSQNAFVSAAKFVCALAEGGADVSITPEWRRFVNGLTHLDDATRAALVDPASIAETLPVLPPPLDAFAHALTRMTASPTVASIGTKTNTIPGSAEIEIDVRTLPGQARDEVLEMLAGVAERAGVEAEFEIFNESVANSSSIETDLWTSIEKTVSELVPSATVVPAVTTGGNDARFFRYKDRVAYGSGLFSSEFGLADFIGVFHGPNERIDLESLALTKDFYIGVIKNLLS